MDKRNSGINRSAEHLLARLAPKGSLSKEGLIQVGIGPAQFADAEILIANDLAIRHSDGSLEITGVGRAHLARLQISCSAPEIDPFLGQHLELERRELQTPSGRARVNIDTAESPLVWLARRKGRDGHALIEPVQLQAGERLRTDFTRAQLTPRVTANWTSVARDRGGWRGCLHRWGHCGAPASAPGAGGGRT
jgi:Domain of unknown function (DUF6456)